MAVIEEPLVDVIVSGVHDVKNVIFDALTRIDVARQHAVAGNGAGVVPLLDEASTALDQAVSRLSAALSAYRLERHENPVALLPVVVPDFLAEILLRGASRGDEGAIAIDVACRCEGLWLFDRELVGEALVNAIQNARRFAVSRIRIGADATRGWLNLRVEDDGPGFEGGNALPGTESRGVGLLVGARIARLHERGGRTGRLDLSTGGELGGAVFSLWLPG